MHEAWSRTRPRARTHTYIGKPSLAWNCPIIFLYFSHPMHSISPNFSSKNRRAKGFTLIELLVVLVILTLLAGLVGPRVMNLLGGAKSKTAALQISDLEKSLDIFKLDVGRFPTTEEGLSALAAKPATANGWNGPYIKGGVPADPWGKPYGFTSPAAGGGVDILTLGADGAAGGDGENADIRNKP